jgi:hypothetical protein
MSASHCDLPAAVQAGFATLPERYLGAQPGFDATYRVLLGDSPAREVRCGEHEATVHAGATKRRADVVFSTDPETWQALRRGELTGSEAFRRRRLRVRGRLDLAIAFEGLFSLEDGSAPLLSVHDVRLECGQRISALTTGQGPDVVLIHGLGSTTSSFLDTAAFFAALRRIYLDAPFGDDGFYPRLAELAAPGLFVWGEHDEVIRPSLRHHVAQWLPSAEQVVLEDSGHIPQVERPERVGELLHEHFARAGKPARRGPPTTAAA